MCNLLVACFTAIVNMQAVGMNEAGWTEQVRHGEQYVAKDR
jgi:hypothetical protein